MKKLSIAGVLVMLLVCMVWCISHVTGSSSAMALSEETVLAESVDNNHPEEKSFIEQVDDQLQGSWRMERNGHESIYTFINGQFVMEEDAKTKWAGSYYIGYYHIVLGIEYPSDDSGSTRGLGFTYNDGALELSYWIYPYDVLSRADR